MEELAESFSFERVSKSGAKFDPEKSKWFNQQYLRNKPLSEIAIEFEKVLVEHNITFDRTYVEMCCDLLREKAHFVHEFWELGSYFFIAPQNYDEKLIAKKWNDKSRDFFSGLPEVLRESKSDAASIEVAFKAYADAKGIPPNSMMQLARVLVSGLPSGPGVFDTLKLIGNNESASRIEAALQKLP